MPKIIINEIDNTARTSGVYQNFSVVVPGFCGPNAKEGFFDDNGIFEVSSQARFVEYVGKINQAYESEAKAPTLTVFGGTVATNYKTVEPEEYYITYHNELYEAVEQGASVTDGWLQGNFFLGPDAEYATIDAIPEATVDNLGSTFRYLGETTTEPIYENGAIYECQTVGEDPEISYAWVKTTATKGYKFTLATNYSGTTKYVRIKSGDEGCDSESGVSLGNQIAYELLGLGYTVLYKKLDSTTTYKDNVTDPGLTGVNAMKTAKFWEALKDKATYDFRFITTGGFMNQDAYEQIAKIVSYRKGDDELEPVVLPGADLAQAPGRGDCCALVDVPEESLIAYKTDQSMLIKQIRALSKSIFDSTYINEYCKIFMPKVLYDISDDYYTNNIFPASFHYLACAAKAFSLFDEWFAVSGYDRGISDLKIIGTTLSLGDLAVSALQPRIRYDETQYDEKFINKAINVVTKIRGRYYLWGNRTAHEIGENGLIATDFANVRELCTSLKKVIWMACKQLTYSPNSDLLWINFCNKVRPLLDKMRANEGVRDYAFVKVPTNKKGVMKGKVRIVPIEAVEDFEIDLYLENSIEGTIVEIEES